jgi:hypothetical protein
VPNLANLGLLTIADQSELEITPGKGALPARDVAFIQQLIAQFDSKKIAVESLTLPPLARELHVKIKNQPYYVKFNLDADMQQQAGSYFAVIEKLTGEKGIPKEYIDVRVEEKVYYR